MTGAGRPTVALLSLGGTISAVGRDRLDLAYYIENRRSLRPGELVASVPELAGIAEITEMSHPTAPSHALTHHDWIALADTLAATIARPDVDGIVLTHGTNTLEETAWFLSLVLPVEKPVVLTGAMRPSSGLSSDGPLNLLSAVRVAAAPQSRGRGVLVCMAQHIFSARSVTKRDTYRVEAFEAPNVGPIGLADVDGAVLYHAPPPPALPRFDPSGGLPRVDVVVSYVGADGAQIEAAVAAGARGIISAGTGAGRPTPAEDQALTTAAERGVLVGQASRVGAGRVVSSPGLREKGFVTCADLPPWKARILFALALTIAETPDTVQEVFDSYTT